MMQHPPDPVPPTPKKPRKPLGSPLDWTSADMAELATVTGHDKQAAAALWRNEAPGRFKSLLQATETEEGAST